MCVETIQSRMQKESTEYGNKFRNLQPNHKVQQWRKFPVNLQKKKVLMIFFDQRIKTRQFRLRDNVVCVACKEECNQFSSEDAYTPGGGEGSHGKGAGMLVVSFRGINFGFSSPLGCSGQNTIIFSRKGLF